MKTARQPEEIEAVKARILAEALEILTDEGFEQVTMRSLARRMSMTAPNLYNYFRSKEEIYITLMLKGFEQLTALLEKELQCEQDPTGQARALLRTYVKFGLEQRRVYALMFSAETPKYRDFVGTEHEALSAREHELSMALVDLCITVVKEFASAVGQTLDGKKARLVVASIWSVLHGMVSLSNSDNLQYVIDGPEPLLDALCDRLLDPRLMALA